MNYNNCMVDLISLTIFLFALGGIAFMLWKKMPLLASVSDNLIEESFVIRPQRLHRFLERTKTLYQEQYHHYLVFSFLERLILAVRDMIGQTEQGLLWLLRHVQSRQNGSGSSAKHARYLNRLHAWKKKNGNGNAAISQEDENSSSSVDGLLPPQ